MVMKMMKRMREEDEESWKNNWWWCTIRYSRHAWSNGCILKKKNQTV